MLRKTAKIRAKEGFDLANNIKITPKTKKSAKIIIILKKAPGCATIYKEENLQSEVITELKNKTVIFLGDSITQGVGASSVENCYVSLFQKAHPEARVHNFGISGTRIAMQLKPSANSSWDKYFASRICDMPKEADLICIFGGTNDHGHGDAPFGSIDDTDGYSFSGGLNDLYTQLIEKYPIAKIVVFTPTHKTAENELHEKPDGAFTLKDYVERIRETAEKFSLPVLDLYASSGIQPLIPIHKDLYMPDGLHPSDAGYQRLFEVIDAFIKAL